MWGSESSQLRTSFSEELLTWSVKVFPPKWKKNLALLISSVSLAFSLCPLFFKQKASEKEKIGTLKKALFEGVGLKYLLSFNFREV